MLRLTTFIISTLFYLTAANNSSSFLNTIEDAFLDFEELAIKYQYNVEVHEVITEDGYILTIFHIYRNLTKNEPVLLEHGFPDSADTWIFPGPGNAIGYYLVDNGFDVWCGNARGNKYSRNHTELNPEDDIFWAFSFDEIGYYDLPATIDYILEKTDSQQLRYIGHSQGTTALYAMLSLRPEYNEKIKIGLCLSPVAFMSNAESPLFRAGVAGDEAVNAALDIWGRKKILAKDTAFSRFNEIICQLQYITYSYCTLIIFLLSGYGPEQFTPEMVALAIGHFPAGSSRQNLDHYLQNGKTGNFQRYDFGADVNFEKYGSVEAPDYNLTEICAPIALFCGKNDWLSSLLDVDILRGSLRNVTDFYIVPYDKWAHIDFVWGKDVIKYIGVRILETFVKY